MTQPEPTAPLQSEIAPPDLESDPHRAVNERQSFVQLFGPVQNEGSLFQVPGGGWHHPGAATSTSYKTFWFNRAWQRITWAALKIEWIPNHQGNSLRLIHADDGPSNITTIAEVAGSNNTNPAAAAFNVTAALQALARGGRPKHLGWQMRSSGGNRQVRIYQIHLEILEAQ